MKLSLPNRALATSTVCRSLWGIRPPTANALSQALDEVPRQIVWVAESVGIMPVRGW